MFSLGYTYNFSHPLLQSLDNLNALPNNKPILIVGYDKAIQFSPNIKFDDKVIDESKHLYYALSKEEGEEKHKENLTNFLKYCFNNLIKDYKVVKIIDLKDLQLLTTNILFLYEDNICITLTTIDTVYYLNKQAIAFFHNIYIEDVITYLNNKKIQIISWDCFEYFGAYLKSNNCYESKQRIIDLLKPYGDIQLYAGVICLNWLNELQIKDNLQLWLRAYEVENYLSNCKIKVDRNKLYELSEQFNDNHTLSVILHKINKDDHITQKYNGTDKITGRMYCSESGFSLQTLPQSLKSIIIPEPNSLLVEFDYQYFEYSLLAQIVGLPLDKDPHLYMSKLIFNTEDKRDIGKTLNYALLYGKQLDKVLDELYTTYTNLALSKEQLHNILQPKFKKVKELSNKLNKELKKNGYIVNYYGRQIIPEKSYACLNNYIQSTAADFVIIKLLKLKSYLSLYPRNSIVLQIHDSILLNLSINDIENTDIAKEIKSILEQEENKLTALTKLKYGTNWEHLK